MCKVILAISTPYHADGGVRSLTDASGKPVFYEYDWRGKLPAVKDGNGRRWQRMPIHQEKG